MRAVGLNIKGPSLCIQDGPRKNTSAAAFAARLAAALPAQNSGRLTQRVLTRDKYKWINRNENKRRESVRRGVSGAAGRGR